MNLDEKIGKIESRVNKDVTSIATEYLGKDLKKEVNTLFKPFNNVNDKNFSKINKITTTDKCSIFMSTPKVVSIKHQNSSSSISPIYTNKMSDGITINTVTKTDSCESVVDDKNTYLDSPQVSKDSEYIKRQENVRRYIRTEEEVNLIYDKNNTNKKLCFKMAKLNSALFRWFHRKIVKNPSLDFSNSFRDYIGYVQNIIKENANTESASIEFSKDEGRQTLESVESICKNVDTEETSKHVQKEETKKEDVSKFLEAITQDDIEITEEGSVFKEKCTFFFNDKKWENRGACVCFLKNEPEKQLIIRNYTSIASIILNVRINSLKNVKKEEKNKISFTTVSNPPLDQKQPNRPHLILLKFKTPQAVDDFLVKINN
ncbi:hypothetical protein A3Q56_07285 [Intoshia linei]|uniref:RanBD1 domain-containing protein n=1 Tax=Intoshia linei TaxID=1819745 RepID=A0A177AUE4_9BILA|nr:hypothetical protein A3Q56_07285 [Intoshia linei]